MRFLKTVPAPVAAGDLGIEIMTWTPQMAAEALAYNTHNRHVRDDAIERYARDMANGDWKLTGEAIKFAKDGTLLDGQHRLMAIVQSQATVQMLTVYGLENEAQDVMDTGAKRGAADQLGLHGHSNAANLAAATRLALDYEAGNLRKAGQKQIGSYTNAEIIRFVNANPDIVDATAAISALKSKLPMRPSVATFTLWVLRRINGEQADELFDDIANMRTDGNGDPRYTLLRRLQNAKTERMTPVSEAHYIFRTWNAMRDGQQLSTLKTGNVHGTFDFAKPA